MLFNIIFVGVRAGLCTNISTKKPTLQWAIF